MSGLDLGNGMTLQGGYKVSMVSEKHTDELDKLAVNVNESYLIIIPKNIKGQEVLEHWVTKDYRNEEIKMIEKLEKLQLVIDQPELFEIIEDQKQAYLEFLRMSDKSWRNVFKNFPPSKYPIRPSKSFELLKDWYFQVWEIDKEEFLRTSMDSGGEVLNQLKQMI